MAHTAWLLVAFIGCILCAAQFEAQKLPSQDDDEQTFSPNALRIRMANLTREFERQRGVLWRERGRLTPSQLMARRRKFLQSFAKQLSEFRKAWQTQTCKGCRRRKVMGKKEKKKKLKAAKKLVKKIKKKTRKKMKKVIRKKQKKIREEREKKKKLKAAKKLVKKIKKKTRKKMKKVIRKKQKKIREEREKKKKLKAAKKLLKKIKKKTLKKMKKVIRKKQKKIKKRREDRLKNLRPSGVKPLPRSFGWILCKLSSRGCGSSGNAGALKGRSTSPYGDGTVHPQGGIVAPRIVTSRAGARFAAKRLSDGAGDGGFSWDRLTPLQGQIARSASITGGIIQPVITAGKGKKGGKRLEGQVTGRKINWRELLSNGRATAKSKPPAIFNPEEEVKKETEAAGDANFPDKEKDRPLAALGLGEWFVLTSRPSGLREKKKPTSQPPKEPDAFPDQNEEWGFGGGVVDNEDDDDEDEDWSFSGGKDEDEEDDDDDDDEAWSFGGGEAENEEDDETMSIGGGEDEDEEDDETMSFGGGEDEDEEEDETISIGGGEDEDEEDDETMSFGGGEDEDEEDDETISIGGGEDEDEEDDETMSFGGGEDEDEDDDDDDEDWSFGGGKNEDEDEDDDDTIMSFAGGVEDDEIEDEESDDSLKDLTNERWNVTIVENTLEDQLNRMKDEVFQEDQSPSGVGYSRRFRQRTGPKWRREFRARMRQRLAKKGKITGDRRWQGKNARGRIRAGEKWRRRMDRWPNRRNKMRQRWEKERAQRWRQTGPNRQGRFRQRWRERWANRRDKVRQRWEKGRPQRWRQTGPNRQRWRERWANRRDKMRQKGRGRWRGRGVQAQPGWEPLQRSLLPDMEDGGPTLRPQWPRKED